MKMRKLHLLLATGATIAAFGVGGATLALLTDQAGPSSQEFVAGTLRLDGRRGGGDTVPGPMFYLGGDQGLNPTGEWAPGDTQVRWFEIQNVGTLAARMTKISATMPEDADKTLAEQLYVRVTDEYGLEVAAGKLSAFLDEEGEPFRGPAIELDPGDILTLTFEVSLPLGTTDEFQGLSASSVTFSVSAEQVRNNP